MMYKPYMTPTIFHILLALAYEDASAADLWRQARRDTDGLFSVSERTFYAALPALAKRGWVERHGEGRGTRYHLTPFGHRQLSAEAIRIKHAVTLLHDRL